LRYDLAQNRGAVIMRTTIQETKTYRIRNSWARSQGFDNLMYVDIRTNCRINVSLPVCPDTLQQR